MESACRSAGTVCFFHVNVALKCAGPAGAEKHCDVGPLSGDIRLSHVECVSVDASQALVVWFFAGTMSRYGHDLMFSAIEGGANVENSDAGT